MKRLFILVLAMFVSSAPLPALAMRAACVDAMPAMATMDHGSEKGSCCDDKHKACLQACDSIFSVAMTTPPGLPYHKMVDAEGLLPSGHANFTIARIASGLDRPPRTIA